MTVGKTVVLLQWPYSQQCMDCVHSEWLHESSSDEGFVAPGSVCMRGVKPDARGCTSIKEREDKE